MLGTRAEYNGLRISPCLPAGWEQVAIRREYRGTVYDVEIKKSSKCFLELIVDGKVQKDNFIQSMK
jgi:cellobiose phosphorylase